MATTREPVALGLGGDATAGAEEHRKGTAVAESGHGSAKVASDQGLPSLRSSAFSCGGGRVPWTAGKAPADAGSEETSSITMDDVSPKEVTEAPSSDRPAPMSRHEFSEMAQQARKAAFMYGSPLRALRANVARASALGDDAQSGGAQARRSAGTSGSPLPFYTRAKANAVPSPQPLQQQHPHVHAPAAEKRPGTAQLTIFYAGMVNVYDEVPIDKAQAIMLLAGTGNAWSSSYSDVVASSDANPGRAGGVSRPESRACSPAPQVPAPSAAGAATKIPDRQVTPTVELPQARKASLARFLEKRKDRVRKGPYIRPNEEAARGDASRRNSRENSPSHSENPPSGKPPRRSRSPPGHEASGLHSPPSSRPSTSEDRRHGTMPREELEYMDAMNAQKSSPSR